ncbi:MAG: hypothetical protein JWQ74_101 [Marmoricola sp.]|nr:hypothetical protein [Marmoricola sp.]
MSARPRPSSADVVSTLLSATSIAIVGASDDGTKASGRTLRYLKKYGFAGDIYPVNPRRELVQGQQAYASIAELPVAPDLAVIVLPQVLVPQAIEECGTRGIRFAVVFASGYAEIGPEGAVLQDELAAVALRAGVRVLGPNSVGAVSAGNAVTAAFMTGLDQDRFTLRDDKIAFVSQSGAMGGFILNLAQSGGLGIGRFFSTGNEVDLDLGELIEGLVEEGSTEAILAYVEGVRDGARFERALARAHERGVPVCVMKVGRSDRGAAAAVSHTGALAGSDAVFDGVLRRYGATRAHDVEQLLDFGRLCIADKMTEGRRASIVTLSGGAGVLMTDYAEELDLDVFEWSEEQQAAMAAILPSFASVTNPIDTTGAIASDQTMLTDALRVCVDNPDTDMAVILLGNLEVEEAAICERIIEVARSTPKPVLVAWVGGSGNPRRILTAAGVPTFDEPVRAMRAASALAAWSAAVKNPWQAPAASAPDPEAARVLDDARHAGKAMLDEIDSKRLLARAGVSVTREEEASDPESAAAAATALGFPVVVKLLSDEVDHKSDVGGVKLGLRTEDEVRQAAREVLEVATRLGLKERKVVVQESVSSAAELILGASIDPSFGPVTLLGAGGIFTEILRDAQIRPAPVSLDEAHAMIDSLGSVALLRGARGMPRADEDALARLVADFSAWTAALGDRLESIDVNPLVIRSDGTAVALDAVVRLSSTGSSHAER